MAHIYSFWSGYGMANKTPKKCLYTQKKNNFVILTVTPITPMNPQNIIELKCLLRVPITLHTPNILLKRILPTSGICASVK